MRVTNIVLDLVDPQAFFNEVSGYDISYCHIEGREWDICVPVKYLIPLLDCYFRGDVAMIGEWLEDNWDYLN